jgi:hypothetical protein
MRALAIMFVIRYSAILGCLLIPLISGYVHAVYPVYVHVNKHRSSCQNII